MYCNYYNTIEQKRKLKYYLHNNVNIYQSHLSMFERRFLIMVGIGIIDSWQFFMFWVSNLSNFESGWQIVLKEIPIFRKSRVTRSTTLLADTVDIVDTGYVKGKTCLRTCLQPDTNTLYREKLYAICSCWEQQKHFR